MIYYDSNIITSQIVFSAVVVWLFRQAKKSNLPILKWINENNYALNKVIAVVASGVVAMGLSWNYSYTPEGVFTLQIANLTWVGVYTNLKQWIFSYIIQQTGYRITEPKVEPMVINSLTGVTGV